MDEIAVSVIMICYNQAQYIEQAVSSVLMQKTNFRYELLIGDDASTDETPEILKKLQKQHPNIIRLFLRKHNLGATRNAYELLMEAKGKYLAFCEGDDYWLSEWKLSKQLDFLDKHKEYIGCSHYCVLVNEDGTPKGNNRISWVRYKDRFTWKDFSGGRYLPGQTASIMKRNIFQGDKGKYADIFLTHRNISDRQSMEIYLLQGDFHCIREYLSAYRQVLSPRNVTYQAYKNNKSRCLQEILLVEEMERYAQRNIGKEVFFIKKRCDILIDAIKNVVFSKDKKQIAMLKEILCRIKLPPYAYLYLPYGVIRKIFFKLNRIC